MWKNPQTLLALMREDNEDESNVFEMSKIGISAWDLELDIMSKKWTSDIIYLSPKIWFT